MRKIVKSFAPLLGILFAFTALLSCARVKIADDEWCADAGRYGAECFHFLSKKERSLNKFEWDQLRVGQICTASSEPGEAFANIKAALLKLCSDTDRCTEEQIKERDTALRNLMRNQRKMALMGVVP